MGNFRKGQEVYFWRRGFRGDTAILFGIIKEVRQNKLIVDINCNLSNHKGACIDKRIVIQNLKVQNIEKKD